MYWSNVMKQNTKFQLEDAVNKVKSELEKTIKSRLPFEIQRSLLPISGKLNRAQLLLAFADLGGGINYKSINFAVAVELIHWASLIQDDVVDQALWRRNKPSINSHFGEGTALLISDWMFSETIQLLLKCDLYSVKIISQTIKVMALGELDQEIKLNNKHVSTCLEYFRYIYKKTALFFEVCSKLGIYSSCNDSLSVFRAGRIGFWWGMAYQLADDLNDLVNMKNNINGEIEDFNRGIFTLPLIMLNHKCPILEQGYGTQEIIDMLKATSIIDNCLNIKDNCLKKAQLIYNCHFLKNTDRKDDLLDQWLTKSISETSLIS